MIGPMSTDRYGRNFTDWKFNYIITPKANDHDTLYSSDVDCKAQFKMSDDTWSGPIGCYQ